MTNALTLRIPLPSRHARRILGALLVLACCLLSLSGSGPYPVGAVVRSWGVVGRVVRWSYEGQEYTATAESRDGAITLDWVLWRVGQGRPGYVFVPYEEARP